MSDPSIVNLQENEYIGKFAFDADTGYIYNSGEIEFVGGSIKLKDQGGGTYVSSSSVTFPVLKPERVRKWFNVVATEVLNSETITYQLQFSNDDVNWGINPPDYNDGQWWTFTLNNTAMLNYLKEVILPDGNEKDSIKVKAILNSDSGTATPELQNLEVTYYSSDIYDDGFYNPIFTNRQDVATLGQIPINKVNDVAIKDADMWVIAQLKNAGIDYALYVDDESLALAARYRCLCILTKSGVAKVVSGPLSGAAADAMSKTWGTFGKSAYSAYYSESDWCDMAGKAIQDFTDSFRVGEGSAESDGGSPGIKSTNFFRSNGPYSQKYWHKKHWR